MKRFKQPYCALLAGLILCFTGSVLLAQQTPRRDTVFFEPLLENTHLKPIVIGMNGKYYYGGQRLRNQYSLEIPFGEMDDPEVNRYFTQARTIRTVGSVVSALPSIYFLVTSRSAGGSGVSRQTFWITYFGAIGVSLASNLVANSKLRRAVNTYNSRLGRPRFGLSAEPLQNNAIAVGFSLKKTL
ncbi:hypothetical protein [Runella sp.]|uniref:hypothetical protein n=1 Tax=Runella sp. TaxID=1960881 RepID=UPI003D153117